MNARLGRWAASLAWPAVVVSVGVAISLAQRIAMGSTNHLGIDPRLAIPVFIAGAACAGAKWLERRWTVWLILAGVCVAFALLTLLAVQANVLVPYDLWLKRGMPPRPF